MDTDRMAACCDGDLLTVQYLGDYLDRTAVLQHCVDLQDWFTAGHLCMLDDRHIQVSFL